MTPSSLAGIILAAGKGTRMKSELPKALHSVCGVPMAELIARAMKEAGVDRPVIVVGHGGERLIEALGDGYDFVWQREQLGTGHATGMAADLLKDHSGSVLVTPGDTPLLSGETLRGLARRHAESGALCTVATIRVPDPYGYGRIVRDANGNVREIVEHKDASEEVRKIDEINSGIFCFDARTLFELLPQLGNNNSQGEYYLTDMVAAVNAKGGTVAAYLHGDFEELSGVNDRWQLVQSAKALRLRLLKRHAMNGVTILDPDTTYIGVDVQIGRDTEIEPGTILEGNTSIGENCSIGPYSRIISAHIESDCIVRMSHINGATVKQGARCGPFCNLRPGAVLGERAKVGNFVEVKNATLEEDVSVSHLSYIGDGKVGKNTNIGAGTIFCNYDGYQKHFSEVGEGVFVGSNTTLVSPIHVGDGAIIAAGSVITHNVPGNALGIGRGRQEVKEEWAIHWRKRKQSSENH
jgi:bifunctional UDP-N-acetylglucosamine pyrophosphorylase/glucosamine-1-phosphate N-acetyltransferase